MKLKKLPTLRGRKRYISFRLHSEEPLDFPDVRNAVWNSVLNWLGEERAGRADVWIMKREWNQRTQTGLIRCAPAMVEQVKLALALVHQIGDSKVAFQVTRVSGTIKSARGKK